MKIFFILAVFDNKIISKSTNINVSYKFFSSNIGGEGGGEGDGLKDVLNIFENLFACLESRAFPSFLEPTCIVYLNPDMCSI